MAAALVCAGLEMYHVRGGILTNYGAGLGTASEIAQRVGLLRGTYDVFDILTFALAVIACATLEYVIGPLRAPERSAAPASR